MDIEQLRKEQYFIILGTEDISRAMTTCSFLSFPPMPHCCNCGHRCLHWMNTCPIYARRKGNQGMACFYHNSTVIKRWKKVKFSMVKRREEKKNGCGLQEQPLQETEHCLNTLFFQRLTTTFCVRQPFSNNASTAVSWKNITKFNKGKGRVLHLGRNNLRH